MAAGDARGGRLIPRPAAASDPAAPGADAPAPGAARPTAGRRRRVPRWILVLAGSGLVLGVAALGCAQLSTQPRPVAESFGPGDPVPTVLVRDAAGATVRWVEVGDPAAPGILLVHGSPGGWDAFLPWLRDGGLAERAHLMAPDRLGFGGSKRGTAVPSLERQAAVLAERLEERPRDPGGRTRPVLVAGHSLGGSVAARLAADRPDLVDTLLLVAPSVDPDLEEPRWYNRVASWGWVEAILPTDLVTSNREIEPLRGELAALDPLWSRIEARVVVLQGLDDALVPPGNADYVERKVPAERRRIERVPDAGHFLLWRQPELVRGELVRWLESRAGAAVEPTGPAEAPTPATPPPTDPEEGPR